MLIYMSILKGDPNWIACGPPKLSEPIPFIQNMQHCINVSYVLSLCYIDCSLGEYVSDLQTCFAACSLSAYCQRRSIRKNLFLELEKEWGLLT